jgi:hypothetical protein
MFCIERPATCFAAIRTFTAHPLPLRKLLEMMLVRSQKSSYFIKHPLALLCPTDGRAHVDACVDLMTQTIHLQAQSEEYELLTLQAMADKMGVVYCDGDKTASVTELRAMMVALGFSCIPTITLPPRPNCGVRESLARISKTRVSTVAAITTASAVMSSPRKAVPASAKNNKRKKRSKTKKANDETSDNDSDDSKSGSSSSSDSDGSGNGSSSSSSSGDDSSDSSESDAPTSEDDQDDTGEPDPLSSSSDDEKRSRTKRKKQNRSTRSLETSPSRPKKKRNMNHQIRKRRRGSGPSSVDNDSDGASLQGSTHSTPAPVVRKRGRPKGSKNRPKLDGAVVSSTKASSSAVRAPTSATSGVPTAISTGLAGSVAYWAKYFQQSAIRSQGFFRESIENAYAIYEHGRAHPEDVGLKQTVCQFLAFAIQDVGLPPFDPTLEMWKDKSIEECWRVLLAHPNAKLQPVLTDFGVMVARQLTA